jgi:hypothetical protein
LIHSPFSNFLCCVTIVKVSSIWFLQWFPFSYNVHYYFGKLFFFDFYLYLLVAWICVKHQLSYLQFALLPAFYNHYGWWTCSWSEDNLQLQSTWSKVWQGKLFNCVSTLTLSLSCFPENAKNLWIHALRNSSALYRFTDMQMLTIVISAHFDNYILTGGNTVFAWLCSCKLKRWVDSKPDC